MANHSSPGAGALAVDLELVIAVDVSLSMDIDEQRLQRDGYVAAFRDPEIHKAITSGPNGRIVVTYLEWAGPPNQQVVHALDRDRRRARRQHPRRSARARAHLARPHDVDLRGSAVIRAPVRDKRRSRGIRRVIDVSGDGPNNAGVPVVPVRDELIAKGIVINGLPIMLKLPAGFFDLADLDLYYTDCVIGGTGAFMIPIKEKSEFLTATRRKLLLEISGYEPPAAHHPRAGRRRPPPERLPDRREAVAALHGRPLPELSLVSRSRNSSQRAAASEQNSRPANR